MCTFHTLEIAFVGVAAVATAMQALAALAMAYLAYRKFIKEEYAVPTESRLQVFSTAKQTTELRASREGLECFLYDSRKGRGGTQWVLPAASATPVVVSPTSRTKGCGVFAVGPRKNWLYSKKVYGNPQTLKSEIERIIAHAAELSAGDARK